MGNIDPAMLLRVGNAFSRLSSKPDDRCTLLTALKPYLRQGRQNRVDEAIRILQMLRLAELFRKEVD